MFITYLFIEIFNSLTISNVWRVIHIPENDTIKEHSANLIGDGIVVIESIITPFDISKKPQSKAVNVSLLKGENTIKSSQITEKNTMYPPIITEVIADSLTEAVKGFEIVN